MTRYIVLSALLLALVGTFALAKPGVVRTRDGRTIEGDVTDNGKDGVSIKTKFGSITIATSEVQTIEYAANIKELYEKRLAALPKPPSAAAHVELGRWLYDNKEYELAHKELDKALAIDPNNADALLLKQMVSRTMVWESTRVKNGGTTPVATQPAHNPRDRKVLDADQINLIRQMELKDTDRVRVRLERDVVRRFAEKQNVTVQEMTGVPDFTKALLIIRREPAMANDVRILSDPQSLMEFKTRIQPVLITGCASANCHGGVNAGVFRIISPANDDAATYTNFYMLTQYSATVDNTQHKAINRAHPSNSLLLQYGLPFDAADLDHPQAANFQPAFRTGRNDQRYNLMLAWIQNSLGTLEPQYNIDFPLPWQKAVPDNANPQPEQPQPEQPQPNQPQPQVQGQPAAEPQPQAQPQPANNPNQGNQGNQGGADDRLKEIRERIRPVGM